MKEATPPLGAEFRRLLEVEQRRPAPTADIKASVRSSLNAMLAKAPSLNGASADGADQSRVDPSLGRGPERALAAAKATATVDGKPLTWLHIAPALGAAFLLGGALGAWLDPLGNRAERAPAPAARLSAAQVSVLAPPTRSAPSEPTAVPPSSAQDGAGAERTNPEGSSRKSSRSDISKMARVDAAQVAQLPSNQPAEDRTNRDAKTRLAAERALIDAARSALVRRNAPSALEALTRHEMQFPGGLLAEERAALMVQSLASAGRIGEAGERAARFRLRYPQSLLLPIVNEAVGARGTVAP